MTLRNSNGTQPLCLHLRVPVAGRERESANLMGETENLESLVSKNVEEIQRTLLERVMDILEPETEPSALLDLLKFKF